MAREYGVVMYTCPFPQWSKIITQIDEDDLYVNQNESILGYENEPHVTVLYGFHKDIDHYGIVQDISKFSPVEIRLKAVEMFDNDKFDVLKITVESPELEKCKKFLEKKYDNTQQFKEFNPHITVAYLKKGKAKKYLNPNVSATILCNEIVYSSPEKKKTYVQL